MSEAIVWQELSEYVVTRELNDRMRRFLAAYTAVLDRAGDPNSTGKMGVWISGFFGSGKSHFLKVLGYLLQNRQVHDPHAGSQHRSVELFQDKLADPMLFGDLKRAAAQPLQRIQITHFLVSLFLPLCYVCVLSCAQRQRSAGPWPTGVDWRDIVDGDWKAGEWSVKN
jgi:hypothetical protein